MRKSIVLLFFGADASGILLYNICPEQKNEHG